MTQVPAVFEPQSFSTSFPQGKKQKQNKKPKHKVETHSWK